MPNQLHLSTEQLAVIVTVTPIITRDVNIWLHLCSIWFQPHAQLASLTPIIITWRSRRLESSSASRSCFTSPVSRDAASTAAESLASRCCVSASTVCSSSVVLTAWRSRDDCSWSSFAVSFASSRSRSATTVCFRHTQKPDWFVILFRQRLLLACLYVCEFLKLCMFCITSLFTLWSASFSYRTKVTSTCNNQTFSC